MVFRTFFFNGLVYLFGVWNVCYFWVVLMTKMRLETTKKETEIFSALKPHEFTKYSRKKVVST